MYDENELVIENYHRKKTHANIDDASMHWVLNLRSGGEGNIKR